MTSYFIKLRSRSETRRSTSDNCHALSGAVFGRLWDDPARLECVVDNRVLNVLDGDSWFVDAEHACAFAWRRTHATRELREVVRLQKHDESLAPVLAVDEIVPLGNDVAERTTVVRLTERHATVHATETQQIAE